MFLKNLSLFLDSGIFEKKIIKIGFIVSHWGGSFAQDDFLVSYRMQPISYISDKCARWLFAPEHSCCYNRLLKLWCEILLSGTGTLLFLAATKQLYEWLSPSVRLSVTPFSLCSHHRIIVTFFGIITYDSSDVLAKGQGKRSKVKVTEVKTQFSRFLTVNPVWIHIWWWNDAWSLILLRRGALLFFQGHPSNFKVTRLTKIVEFDPDWAFPDWNSSLNSPMATKWCTKLEVA